MKKFIRPSLAFLAGVISIFTLLGIVEFIWLSLFSRPTESYHLKDMPFNALLIPFIGLLLATLISGLVSCNIAKKNYKLHALMTGSVVLIITAINQIGIPHPIWYTALTIVSIPLMSVLVIRLYNAKQKNRLQKA